MILSPLLYAIIYCTVPESQLYPQSAQLANTDSWLTQTFGIDIIANPILEPKRGCKDIRKGVHLNQIAIIDKPDDQVDKASN